LVIALQDLKIIQLVTGFMDRDQVLRKQLISLLEKNQAHMDFFEAIEDFPKEKINYVFTNGTYTFWQLLEHMRITQNDLVESLLDPKYKEKEWPKEFWPPISKKASPADWAGTISRFKKDLNKLIKLISDPGSELDFMLNKVLEISSHNSYHIGEFAIMRQVMEVWEE